MNRTLTAIAGEKDAGRRVKYFVRGDMGISYGQFSALKRQDGLLVIEARKELANGRPNGLRFTRGEGVKATLLNDLLLEEPQDWLGHGIEAISFEVVHQRDAKLLLVGSLNDLKEWTNSLALCGLEIIEQIGLNRCWESECFFFHN